MKSKSFKILMLLFIFIFPIILSPNASYAETSSLKVDARAALLMEPTSGNIIFEKNIHEKFSPASVTKIMTMLLAMEKIDSGAIKLSDKVTISENSKKMGGSSMILDTGEVRTVEELIKGIAVASGNDASVAMAEYISGTEEEFVKSMNSRAAELGMSDTTFKNCTGLSAAGHVSSAYDISVMSRELLKHKTILKYSSIYMETISEGRRTPIELVNHNKLVRFFKGCDGLKTGFTDDAKYCISATAIRDNVRMLAIIMGAPNYKVRNRDASMLMNFGFSKYETKTILEKNKDVEKIMLSKNSDKFIVAKAADDYKITVEKGTDNKISKKIVINQSQKRYRTGEKIGYCEIMLNNKYVAKVDLYSDRDAKKPSVFENIKDNIWNFLVVQYKQIAPG